MSEKRTIQILNEEDIVIESIDITDKKLNSFESIKKYVSTLVNIKNGILEYFIIDDLGNKILISSENDYKNYKNVHLYIVKIINSNTQNNEDYTFNIFNLNSSENEIMENIKESFKCWCCIEDIPIEKPFFCPNPNCLKGIHKECLMKISEKNEKVRCICGNISDVSEYKSNKLINELAEIDKEKNNIINNLKNKLKEFESAPKKCNKHPKDNLIHYCYDCSKELCGTCYMSELTQHKDHRLIDLDSYNKIEQMILQNDDQLKDLKKGINECELVINSLIKNKKQFLEILQKVTDNIKNGYDKYINELNKKIDCIKRKYKDALNYKVKLDEFFNSLNKNNYNELKNIEEIINDFKFIINQNEVKKDLSNLMEYTNDVKEMNNNNYNNFHKIIDNRNAFRTEIIKYADGSKYIGEIKNDKEDGRGVLYLSNGCKYEGEFKNNKMNGRGIFNWPDGSKYDGEFKDSKRDGKGILYLSNGLKYEGEYKNDKKNGNGIFYWPDGSKYEGEVKDDKRDGRGIYYSNDSKITIGNYQNDIKIGKHISLLFDENYEIYSEIKQYK